MNPISISRKAVAATLLLSLGFATLSPLILTPSAEAAPSGASFRIIKKLKKQIAALKKQLAAAKAGPPESAPFIEMVRVGNAGNAADPSDGDSDTVAIENYGAVPYDFQIGQYEVTLTQYTAFLNAVAASDPHGLYDASMATNLNIAGIARSGTSGGYTYSVIGTVTRPVTYVNWYDAARFCNWLHHGRPTGGQDATTTERGAYTLDGATSGGVTITRNPGANYWIPSEDEWYKAAYHQPAGQGGDGDGYWLYPTGRNVVPGNTIGPLPLANHVNYQTAVYSVTQAGTYNANQGYLTAVGSYPGSPSFYGTFDQGGNVAEWTDPRIRGSISFLRGGAWYDRFNIRSSARDSDIGSSGTGFRVASP